MLMIMLLLLFARNVYIMGSEATCIITNPSIDRSIYPLISTSEHRYELRIHQPRQATPMGEGLQVDLLTELTASYAVTTTTTTTALIREVSKTRMFPVPGVSSILKGEKYLLLCAIESKGGLSAAQQLIADALSLTVDAKLRTLQERIEFSMKATAAVDAYRFVSAITATDMMR